LLRLTARNDAVKKKRNRHCEPSGEAIQKHFYAFVCI
jgi:hypothetical protein